MMLLATIDDVNDEVVENVIDVVIPLSNYRILPISSTPPNKSTPPYFTPGAVTMTNLHPYDKSKKDKNFRSKIFSDEHVFQSNSIKSDHP